MPIAATKTAPGTMAFEISSMLFVMSPHFSGSCDSGQSAAGSDLLAQELLGGLPVEGDPLP